MSLLLLLRLPNQQPLCCFVRGYLLRRATTTTGGGGGLFSSRVHQQRLPLLPKAAEAAARTVETTTGRTTTRLLHSLQQLETDYREADDMEQLVGGRRYDVMIPMPNSMKETTLFVGNLDEFVNDDDLSILFANKISKLQFLPAVVCRKPNMDSLQYGFVCFPNAEEKQRALREFQDYEYRGKCLKVEDIRDEEKSRVRIPERLVEYVIGGPQHKRLRSSGGSSSSNNNNSSSKSVTHSKTMKTAGGKNTVRRISRDDVERLSRGQPAKKKGYGSRNVPHRLNEVERQEFERAAKKGFLQVTGSTGHRRTRKGSPLINIHRQWCDARAKPQIVLYKAVAVNNVAANHVLDEVIVDLSPLRLHGLYSSKDMVDELLHNKWKDEILTAADEKGMEQHVDNSDDDDEVHDGHDDDDSVLSSSSSYTITIEPSSSAQQKQRTDDWSNSPIWKLPVLTLGMTFQGERSRAKDMASALGKLWDIPEGTAATGGGGAKNRRTAGARGGGKTKRKGLSEHRQRRRGGGHRQAW